MIKYNFTMNDDNGDIFIVLDDEKYKNISAKITDIQMNKDGEIEFEMSLLKEHQQFEDDDEFTNAISEAVGDIVKQAVTQVYDENTQAILANLESKATEAFKPYNFIPSEGETFISLFGQKGYVLSEDDEDRLTAINVKTNKTYYFDMPEQLAFLKKEISGKSIILNA